MTDRAEIERLLNQTGRTLEGLPLDYETRFYTERIEPHRDGGGFVNEYSMAYEILHQSDVIKLLVGALRDALDKPMQKPLTLEEAINSEWTVWIEINGWTNPRAGDVWASKRLEGYAMFAFVGESPRSHAAMNRYGKGWRCWASRPTDEEREAAKWEN